MADTLYVNAARPLHPTQQTNAEAGRNVCGPTADIRAQGLTLERSEGFQGVTSASVKPLDCATATQVWHSCAVSGRHHQSLTRKRNLAPDLGRLNLQPRKPATGAHVYAAAAKRSGQITGPGPSTKWRLTPTWCLPPDRWQRKLLC
jgi:hypothetical protein